MIVDFLVNGETFEGARCELPSPPRVGEAVLLALAPEGDLLRYRVIGVEWQPWIGRWWQPHGGIGSATVNLEPWDKAPREHEDLPVLDRARQLAHLNRVRGDDDDYQLRETIEVLVDVAEAVNDLARERGPS